jgi:endonuclease/exonuclease/phosphatase (EEP) superfamily protein YafD
VDRRRPALRLLAWPYALTTVALLAVWLARIEHATVQVLHLATFWATLPALALVVVALLARDGRAALLLAVPAVTWVWSYGTAFLPGAGASTEPDLRLATFNTFVGAPGDDHVLALAEDTGADVLLLQEVFADREEALAASLADRYPHVHADRTPGVGAVVVMSRFPIVDVTPVVDASHRSRPTSVVTLDVDGQPVQAAAVHLLSPCPGCGTSLLERLELEEDVRRAEVGAVLEALDPDVPAVVGGDLNSNDRASAYRRFVAAGFADAHRDAGSGMGFTWPADGRLLPPVVRIDWVLVRGLSTVDAWVGDAGDSDHHPVVVDLSFAREG